MTKVFIVFRQIWRIGADTPEIMGVYLCRPDAVKLRDSLANPDDAYCSVWIQEETVISSGG